MEYNKEIDWKSLSEKRIFFGHQSVGNNVIQGINQLKISDSLNLFSIQSLNDSNINQAVFLHSKIGRNSDPKSKIDEFSNLIREKLKDSVDIVVMKLCYADFNKSTNIEELINYYDKNISLIKSEFPDLKIIHCTAPLNVYSKNVLKRIAKRILKRDINVYINRYNKLIRKNYEDKSIFDIAAFESTDENGNVNTYFNGIPALLSYYASDGGHLNAHGQKRIALEFLLYLQAITKNN